MLIPNLNFLNVNYKLNFIKKYFVSGVQKVQNKLVEFVPWTIVVSSLMFSIYFLETHGLLYAMTMMMIVFTLLGSWFWAILIGLLMLCVLKLRQWFPNIDTYIINFFKFIFDLRYRWWVCSLFCCLALILSNRSLDLEKFMWSFALCVSMWRCLVNLKSSHTKSDYVANENIILPVDIQSK